MSDIVTEISGRVLRVELNRPTRKNALTAAMYETLAGVFASAAKDDQVRAVLWHGAGDVFCAGNDVEDFLENPPGPTDSPQAGLMRAFIGLDKPLVAAVHGAAIGGGATMLTHCDFVLAAENTRFQLPFVDLALVPEFGSSYTIPARLGHLRAAELILLGLPFDAKRAAECGLVTQVVPGPSPLGTATETALKLAAKPSGALRACKRLLKRSSLEQLTSAINAENEEFSSRVRSAEAQEALAAFLRKRQGPPSPLRPVAQRNSREGMHMYRATRDEAVRRVISTRLPTKWGTFHTYGFERELSTGEIETAIAVVLGDVTSGPPLVRIHSQCFTGELLGSLRCDCGDQLEMAMKAISEEGRGLVIYEHQEGRGIGLMAKLRAYALQDCGLDTVEANHALGFEADRRDFLLPAAILLELGVTKVRLLTNNPHKAAALEAAGIKIIARVPCEGAANPHSLGYLRTKKERMGHTLSLTDGPARADRAPDESPFATIPQAIAELRAGRMVVVVDDEDRENEGDLTIAAEKVTPEAINFMATHWRGLICLAMTGEDLDRLDLGPMAPDNTALHGTAFTVSIDAKCRGVTTGISASDRAATILAAIDETTPPHDLARPGHVFPLRSRPGGVLERRGQTEAAVDLARLAGLHPSGVICEIVNDDGTMARLPDLIRFCQRHGLLMISVADLALDRATGVHVSNPGRAALAQG